jgi:cytochrome c oxidase subunit 3
MRESYWIRPESRDTPGPREPSFKMSAEQLLVVLGFVAIGVIFAATLVAYVITRVQVERWRPPGSPGLPVGLLGSTALIFGVSASMQRALTNIRRNEQQALRRSLVLGFAFAIAFVVGQGFNWFEMFTAQTVAAQRTLFAFSFYLLTGLHALHVVGGFVPLAIVLRRSREREYSSSRYDGVRFCVWYWHYLGVIWLVLLSVMVIAQ